VAQRYHQRGFDIIFEPFGDGSTDLLISRDLLHLYVEIKRENPQVHRRVNRRGEIGTTISGKVAETLKDWLQDSELRMEIKLSKLFADSHIPQVMNEICEKAARVDSVRGSTMIVLPQAAEFHYQKGLHTGIILVPADKPIQLFAPTSALVRCTFNLKPNLTALGERIREAGKQLRRDLNRDARANGLVVLECMFGEEEIIKAIQERFWSRLPERCLGVSLFSIRQAWIIPRSNLPAELTEILGYAALNPPPPPS
jgi:hypothetical protein